MTEPTQPLTDEELAEIRASSEWAISANNALRLLAEVDRLRAENTAQAAKLEAAARCHQPVPEDGQGYDDAGNYVTIEQPCGACGTYDEYAVPWPCGTARALGLDQSGEGQANG